jgi:hypothetical protein
MESENELFGEDYSEKASELIFRNLLEFMAISILFCLVCLMSGIFYLMVVMFRVF